MLFKRDGGEKGKFLKYLLDAYIQGGDEAFLDELSKYVFANNTFLPGLATRNAARGKIWVESGKGLKERVNLGYAATYESANAIYVDEIYNQKRFDYIEDRINQRVAGGRNDLKKMREEYSQDLELEIG